MLLQQIPADGQECNRSHKHSVSDHVFFCWFYVFFWESWMWCLAQRGQARRKENRAWWTKRSRRHCAVSYVMAGKLGFFIDDIPLDSTGSSMEHRPLYQVHRCLHVSNFVNNHHWAINLLKPLITSCTNSLTFKNRTLCPHGYVCVLYLSENKQRLVPLTA
jgi:hypothetical protein